MTFPIAGSPPNRFDHPFNRGYAGGDEALPRRPNLLQEITMGWYWWALIIGWPLSGFLALVLNIRDNPRMQENIGMAEVWPVVFGPLWLTVKIWQFRVVT